MGNELLGRVPGPRRRQVPIGDPAERRWPLESSLLRLGVGFFFAVTSPVLIAAAGAPSHLYGKLVVAAGAASVGLGCLFAVRRLARYLRIPPFAEFDGLVIEQWTRYRDEDTEHYVAIDDGRRPTAWAFSVSHELYLSLRPGMRVHVQINERRNRPINVEAVESRDAVR